MKRDWAAIGVVIALVGVIVGVIVDELRDQAAETTRIRVAFTEEIFEQRRQILDLERIMLQAQNQRMLLAREVEDRDIDGE